MDIYLIEICKECLSNNELVDEFCRLQNIKRPDKLSPLEKEIDVSCGYNYGNEFIIQFINFVRDFIYLPMLTQNKK